MSIANFLFSKIGRVGTLSLGLAIAAVAQDPPSRIARLNYIKGDVSMQPAGLDEWTTAEPNRPFTTGDAVFTDIGSRAEFHLDSAVVRAGESTNFGFLTLNDQTVQLRLSEGDLYVNLRNLDANQTFEVDSPNASTSILRPGLYRFRIAGNGDLTFVVIRQGQAEITAGNQAVNLTPGKSAAISGLADVAYDVEPAPAMDDFDLWSQDRDAAEARLASARYLPRTVVGYEDMDRYGAWQTSGQYGAVWYPASVPAGWAPYHYGHWAWIEPWGWTWVDDAPWGFAPFHYGRWAFISGRWGWCPGPIVVVANRPPVVRPVYAPALVAWFGGAHFGVSVQIGGGAPSLGWVPLGIGEVYTPSYHCSPHYFNNVNVSNTTVVKNVNITNVYNNVYVNKTVYVQHFANAQAPNAVTAMSQTAFASGRPVGQAGMAVAPRQVQNMQIEKAGVVVPPVAPARQALMATNAGARVVRPAAAVMERKVVVRAAPAPAPAPFAARQAYLQQHVGQPHDFAEMHRQVAPSNRTPQVARVTVAPTVKPTNAPQPLQRAAQPPPATPTPQAQPHAQPIQRTPLENAPVPPHPAPHAAVAQPVPHAAPAQPAHAAYPERMPHPAEHALEHPAAQPEHANKPAAHAEHKEKPDEKKDRH